MRRGFTLLEMMIVVGIVAIVSGIATYGIQAQRRHITIDRVATQLRYRIDRTRSLSALAATRLGTGRLVAGTGCTSDTLMTANPQLWIRLDPTTSRVEIPNNLTLDRATGTLTVSCEQFDISAGSEGNARFDAPTAAMTFSFSASGRLIRSNGPAGGGIFVHLHERASTMKGLGFRILPSGITCASSTLASVCDQDAAGGP